MFLLWSAKKFKVKNPYFTTTEIDIVGKKQSFLRNTSFLNKGKVKFLQKKQDTIKHEKR